MQVRNNIDLGTKFLSEGKYEEAIIAFEKAISIDPKNIESYRSLAKVYEQQNDYEAAYQTLMRAANEIGTEYLSDTDRQFMISMEEKKVGDAAGTDNSVTGPSTDSGADLSSDLSAFPFGQYRPEMKNYYRGRNGGEPYYSVKYNYDTEGRLISGDYQNIHGTKGTVTFVYEENRLKSKILSLNGFQIETFFEYGQNGFIEKGVAEYKETTDDSVITHEEETYIYDGDGKLVSGNYKEIFMEEISEGTSEYIYE